MEKYINCGVLADKALAEGQPSREEYDAYCHAPARNGSRGIKFSLLFGEGDDREMQEALPEVDAQEDNEAVDLQGKGTRSEEELRAEYRELIKTKFKRFYTEDTQRMLNRRFRKYREMSGVPSHDGDQSVADVQADSTEALTDKSNGSSDGEVTSVDKFGVSEPDAQSSRLYPFRPPENGDLRTANPKRRGVKSLSRDERADIARRAMKGEVISL